jgi:hypothetical protein
MNHNMDFDPYVIRERNQQVHMEVHSLRLKSSCVRSKDLAVCDSLPSPRGA